MLYHLALPMLFFAALSGPAMAGDWEECADMAHRDRSILACSKIIESGRASGETLALAYHNRGNGYYAERDFDRSLADYTEAIRLAPHRGSAYTSRGFAYSAKNDGARAIADFTEAIRIDPRDARNYEARGVLLATDPAKLDQAVADLRKALSLDPKSQVSRGVLKQMGVTP